MDSLAPLNTLARASESRQPCHSAGGRQVEKLCQEAGWCRHGTLFGGHLSTY